jgi:peptide-methionine (S)-S-oxide reductase
MKSFERPNTLAKVVTWGAFAVLAATAAFRITAGNADEMTHVLPAPAMDEQSKATSETAVFAGGCFWGVQGVFQHVKGVTSAVAGYAGGDKAHAQYETVSTGTTGHAESVRVTFDPQKVSFGQLLQVYFSVAHDPTELNRQGPDEGTQYRSAIFVSSPEQEKVARAYIAQLDATKLFYDPIVTTTGPLKGFYAAEGYHQDYLTRHPNQPYIAINDLPKVEALKTILPALYRPDPVLVGSLSTE